MPPGGDEDVFRLEVAVNDALRVEVFDTEDLGRSHSAYYRCMAQYNVKT